MKFSFEVIEYKIDDLPDDIKKLISSASSALSSAYAPYSNFKVGAAVLLQNGKSITGSNQENAAYPSGLCAERVAFFSAASKYPNEKIVAIAVTTSEGLAEPVAPCGSCRQVMIEYELRQQSDIKIYLALSAGKVYCVKRVADLLPMAFSLTS